MNWTREQFNAYQARRAGLRALQPERTEGLPLVCPAPGKAQSSAGPVQRYQITFTVYAVRPNDWDNISVKPIQDCCVEAGFLPCDDWDVLEGRVISKKAHSKKEERTEIEVVRI